MNMNEYQELAGTTVKESVKDDIVYFTLGLTGEAGEVADKIKKSIRDRELSADAMLLELGDVLWYISQISECLGYSLSEVAERNINKLQSRADRGVIGGEGDDR